MIAERTYNIMAYTDIEHITDFLERAGFEKGRGFEGRPPHQAQLGYARDDIATKIIAMMPFEGDIKEYRAGLAEAAVITKPNLLIIGDPNRFTETASSALYSLDELRAQDTKVRAIITDLSRHLNRLNPNSAQLYMVAADKGGVKRFEVI